MPRLPVQMLTAFLLLVTIPSYSLGPEEKSFPLKPGTCSAALDRIWEREYPASEPLAPGGLPLVTVDVGGEFVRETRIVLTPRSNSAIRTEIFQIAQRPLCKQVEILHESGKYSNLEEAIEVVKVDHKVVEQSKELNLHFQELLSLKVTLVPSSSIYFPARGYVVSIKGATGAIKLELTAPEPTADSVAYSGSPTPANSQLVEWINKLLEVLQISFDSDDHQEGSSSCNLGPNLPPE